MGQQNDKVLFEGHQNPTNKRKHIFPQQPPRPKELCEIPGCHCPLPHPEFNTKVCSDCQQTPPPFLKTKTKPKYYEQESYHPSPPRQQTLNSSLHVEKPLQAQSIPGKIGYYNAWSLPTQKYHIRERSPFDPRHNDLQSSRALSAPENSDNVDTFIQKVTQRIVKAVDAPKVEFERRKQNMNLAD